jgi:hypothetical protein
MRTQGVYRSPVRVPRVSVSPASVIASLALFVALSGTAVAATGGALILGRANTADRATVLSNPNGTPLKLRGAATAPPLGVGGNQTRVPDLNASLLDGQTAGELSQHLLYFTTPGTYTMTVPDGFTHMMMYARGGGGGGGSHAWDVKGVGGGGGQGSRATVLATTSPGAMFDVDVGDGGAAGGDGYRLGGYRGGQSTVFAHGTDRSYLKALVYAYGGEGGLPAANCPNDSEPTPQTSPGAAGAYESPVGLDGATGELGESGSWYGAQDCTTAIPNHGLGGGQGLAGSGGNGSRPTLAATPGRPGYVIVAFLP